MAIAHEVLFTDPIDKPGTSEVIGENADDPSKRGKSLRRSRYTRAYCLAAQAGWLSSQSIAGCGMISSIIIVNFCASSTSSSG